MFKQEYLKGDAEVRNEYRTPDWVYQPLQKVFNFSIDVAATAENTKCARYFSKEDDGLRQDWGEELPTGMRHSVFNNPPWSDGEYGDWVDKACMEHSNNGITIAQVLPFRPETTAFNGVWQHARYLILPTTRIAFDLPDGTRSPGTTFFSCVAIYTYRNLNMDELQTSLSVGRVIDLGMGLHNP